MQVGLAIAGGGVPGFTAIGVIEALEEEKITISHIAGTSAGAIVASLYAYGYPVGKLKELVSKVNWRFMDIDWKAILAKALFLRPNLEGALKGETIRGLLAELTHGASLSSLKIPCGIVANDIRMGEPIVFSNHELSEFKTEREISISDAVRASSSVPGLYRPIRWKDYVLIDGGILMNCPVRVARNLGAERVISIDPITVLRQNGASFDTGSSIMYGIFSLMLREQMANEHQHADLTLFPQIGPVAPFDFSKIEHCIHVGYEDTTQRMNEIKRTLVRSDAESVRKGE